METKDANKKEGQSNYKKGMEAYNRNSYKEAVEYLEEAAKLLQDKCSFFYLAEVYGNLKNHEKAILNYDKTYACLDPNNPSKEHILVLKCKGEEERNLGNFEKSMTCYETALSLGQKFMTPIELRDLKYEIEESKQEVKRLAVTLERKKYTETLKQAEEMEKRKSYKEAIELYTKCIGLQENAEGYFNRAQCYRTMGSYPEAIIDYQKCIELRKNAVRSDDNLHIKSLFYQGLCNLEMGKYKESTVLIRKASEKIFYTDKLKEEIDRWEKVASERMEVFFQES